MNKIKQFQRIQKINTVNINLKNFSQITNDSFVIPVEDAFLLLKLLWDVENAIMIYVKIALFLWLSKLNLKVFRKIHRKKNLLMKEIFKKKKNYNSNRDINNNLLQIQKVVNALESINLKNF